MSISAIPSTTFTQPPLTAVSNHYQQNLKQLGQDLSSGNLSAAQQDFSSLQQNLQSQSGEFSRLHDNHRLRVNDLTDQNSLLQQLSQLGQDLASGNLSAAQQAYAALQTQSTIAAGHGIRYTEPPLKRPAISAIA